MTRAECAVGGVHRPGGGADVRGAGLQGFRPRRSRSGRRTSTRARPRPVSAFLSAGPESRGLRRVPAHLHDRVRADRRRVGAAGLAVGAALHDHRQLRRAARKPTSSACWRTAPSPTPATCMVALAARSKIGTAAAMFYLAAYAFMNIGAFAVVAHLSGKGERYQNIEDFAGLGEKQPLTAAMLYDLPALPDRRAADRRLLRQVLHLQGGARIAPGVADGAGPAEQRRGRLLLPAHSGR